MLRVLRQCEPVDGDWDAGLDMQPFYYSLHWTTGKWDGPPVVTFMDNVFKPKSITLVEKLPKTNTSHSPRNWRKKPNHLEIKNGVGGWHVSWTFNGAHGIAHK